MNSAKSNVLKLALYNEENECSSWLSAAGSSATVLCGSSFKFPLLVIIYFRTYVCEKCICFQSMEETEAETRRKTHP